MADPRAVKIQFVSGHHGTTAAETVAVASIFVSAALLHRGVLRAFPRSIHSPAVALTVDLLCLVAPAMLTLTQPDLLLAVHLCCCLIGATLAGFSAPPPQGPPKHAMAGRLPFLDEFRGLLMLGTCLSILAVDFQVFPRRFAKTEMFGFSIMDLGTGFFVFSNSLVYGRRAVRTGPSAWRTTFVSFTPLLALGLGRLAFVKGADYHEVVEEYGVHWNFFFTLAGLPLLMLVHQSIPAIRRVPPIAMGLAVLAAYQIALSFGGMTEFVLSPDRTTLVAANKEGLLSLCGYFGLYCVGSGVGQRLFRQPTTTAGTLTGRLGQPHGRLLLGVLLLATLLSVVCHTLIQPASRRLCNAAYALFTVATGLWLVLGFFVVDAFVPLPPEVASRAEVLPAVNDNQLAGFLLANVLTGLTNLTLDTVAASPSKAYGVLILYMTGLCIPLVALRRAGVRLKL